MSIMDNFEKFYNVALRFLSYRPRSEKEVRDKLVRKKASKEIIEKVVAKLKVQKFLNDEEFAKWWIEQRTQFKPRSLKFIKFELKHKGISDDLIELGIKNQELRIESDLELAKKLVETRIKRFRNKFGMTREELYQKLGGFLARRGFDWETIKQSIDELLFK